MQIAVETPTLTKFKTVMEIAMKMGYHMMEKTIRNEDALWSTYGPETCLHIGTLPPYFWGKALCYSPKLWFETNRTHIVSYEKFMEWFGKEKLK